MSGDAWPVAFYSDLNSLSKFITSELKIRVGVFVLKKLFTHFEMLICIVCSTWLLLCILPLLTLWHTVIV